MPGISTTAADRDDFGARGTVYLVGAGPGDPGLLTRRAARLLRRADVIVHDALIGPGILDLAAEGAEIIDVGKRCGGKATSQECINDVLIESARRTRVVVRLKGGDPFVFGRGGEEALALADAGVPFQVVPGVTAGVGVSAYAGIPVTHRDLSSSVTFVTGHEKAGAEPRIDWDAIARVQGTVVVYMGLSNLAEIAARLVRGGRTADTPAALVEWGTVSRQRTVTADLAQIASAAARARIQAPALLIVGEVAALRERLAWFDRLPLRGKRVVVARSRPQPSRLAKALERLGADVLEYPTLRSRPARPDAATERTLDELASYRWLIFSSPVGVAHFWKRLEARGLDARALAGARIASLGIATTAALRRRGITPEVARRTFEVEAVGAALEAFAPLAGTTMLFPREGNRRSEIAEDLRRCGAVVDELSVFETYLDPFSEESDLHTADIAVLPSSSAAEALAKGLAGQTFTGRVVAIGPATAQCALTRGLPVDEIPDEHTIPAVVAAVLRLSSPRPAGGRPRAAVALPAARPPQPAIPVLAPD
ncbi:MAG TPA: uroporphyrinogen-III C-methyltransferase [Longimicrobiaceae bacterium]|nr:uroporphyrinogen-III C-methyltransferase [Longimicrobiaceae bacterium]